MLEIKTKVGFSGALIQFWVFDLRISVEEQAQRKQMWCHL